MGLCLSQKIFGVLPFNGAFWCIFAVINLGFHVEGLNIEAGEGEGKCRGVKGLSPRVPP